MSKCSKKIRYTEGYISGSASPLQIKFDASGSVLAYCGDQYAVKLAGHGASLEKLAVYDWNYPGKLSVRTVA